MFALECFMYMPDRMSVYRSPPKIPEVSIPEKPLLEIVSALRIEINQGLAAIRDIASGKDLKKFLAVRSASCFYCLLSILMSSRFFQVLLVKVLTSVCTIVDQVIAGLWFVSIISNCYSFLTLVYICNSLTLTISCCI